MAAQVITQTKKYEHITPVLQNLHWLPIQARIEFKIIELTIPIVSSEFSIPNKTFMTQCMDCKRQNEYIHIFFHGVSGASAADCLSYGL